MAEDGRQLFCRVITPQQTVFDGQANMIVTKIADGEIGVLVDHVPTVSTVQIGDVRIRQGEEMTVFAVSEGFFRISENLVQILVEEAVPLAEIDVSEAENRVEEAEKERAELEGSAEDEQELKRRMEEIERRQKRGENLVRVARRYREG